MGARDKKLTQLAGEYAVASELCRRGWSAMVMPEAWPGFDIMARSADGANLQIQVKTRAVKSNWAFCPTGEIPYLVVFVQIWDDTPKFFPVPGYKVERMRDAEFERRRPGSSSDQADRLVMNLRWADLEPFEGEWDRAFKSLALDWDRQRSERK